MAKTRLNKEKREILLGLAISKLPSRKNDEMETIKKNIQTLVEAEIKAKYPKKDLDVLEKYENIHRISCITVKSEDHEKYYNFSIKNTRMPRMGHYNISTLNLPNDHEVFKLATKFETIKNELSEKYSQLKSDYGQMIQTAKNFEDLCDIWSEAIEVSDQIIASNSTALVDPRILERVKADVEARKKAQENGK